MSLSEQGVRLRCGECTTTVSLDERLVVAAAEVAVFVAAHQHSGGVSITLVMSSRQ